MRLHTSATQIDFYPVGTGKRFVKRVIWHKGCDTELTSFSTRDRIGMKYDVEGYIANGATVSDFNLNEYTCLLYTSPSPRDKRQSRMPSSA